MGTTNLQTRIRRVRRRRHFRRPGRPTMTTRLSRYVMAEIAAPALLALIVIAFLAAGNELRERSEVIEVGLIRAWDLFRLVMYFMPTLIAYIVAVTYMIGILMAFGALTRSNEFVAVKAAGIPMRQLVVPVIAWGAVLSVLCFVLQDRVQPAAWKRVNALLYEELPQRATLEVLPTGVMHEFGDLRVYIGDRDLASKTLYNIDIIQPQEDGQSRVFYARSAQFVRDESGMKLILRDGNYFQKSNRNFVNRSKIDNYPIPLPSPETLHAPSQRRTLNLRQLLEEENVLKAQYEESVVEDFPVEERRRRELELLRMRMEITERITLPMATFAVSIVAAPLAVRSQRGGRSYAFAIGFVVILGFYLLRALLEPASLASMTEVFLRGVLPAVLFVVLGLVAIWRVDRV